MSRPALWKAAFAACLAGTLVLALLPAPPRLPTNPSDKVQHLLAFAALTLLALAAFGRRAWLAVGLGLSAFGGLIELLQLIPALNRDGDPVDWLVDSAAIAAVLLGAALVRRP